MSNIVEDMNYEARLDALVTGFCSRILLDFRDLKPNLQQRHPEWSGHDLAANLMEFGRGQISEVDKPSQKDIQFITKYVDALNFEDPEVALFTAYAGGCIMGLVQSEQLPGANFVHALQVSAHFAQSEL
jgi:hypothetical protein